MTCVKEKNVLDGILKWLKTEFDRYKSLSDFSVFSKGENDLVTDADKTFEKHIIEAIKKEFPFDNVISEEFFCENSFKDRNWVIDPIDGTINFASGLPVYGSQMCYCEKQNPVTSFCYLPKLNLSYTAEKDKGAYLNGKRLTVNKSVFAKDTVITLCDFSKNNKLLRDYQNELFYELSKSFLRVRLLGASCLNLPAVASSYASACISFTKNPWDVLPSLLILREAGAICRKFDGSTYEVGYPSFVGAANEEVFSKVNATFLKCGNYTELL